MSRTESLNPKSLRGLIESNYNNVAYGMPYLGPWDRTQNYLFIGRTIIILAALGAIIVTFFRASRKITLFWIALLIISLFYSFGEFSFLQKYFYRFAPFFDKIRAPSNMMLLFNFSIIGLASSFFHAFDGFLKKINFLPTTGESHSLRDILYLSKKIFIKNTPVFLGITVFLLISLEIMPAILEPNTLLYSHQKTSEVFAAPPVALRIAEEYGRLSEIDKFRIFKIPGLDYNLTQVLHIFAFDGYNPLSLRRHSAYIDAMVKNEKLVDLAAIKYLPCEFIINRANTLEKIGSLCINKNYFQLAFLVDDYTIANDETDALRETQEADLKNTLILEEAPEQKTKDSQPKKNGPVDKTKKVSIINREPGFWRFTVKTSRNTFLFINQTNYPGWIAKINGNQTKIYQADYLFQAIYIPKGESEVTLNYESKPLINGAILTIIGLSFVFFIILNDLIQKRKNSRKSWQETLKKINDK